MFLLRKTELFWSKLVVLVEFGAKKYDIPVNMANYLTIAQVQNSQIGSNSHSNVLVMSSTD